MRSAKSILAWSLAISCSWMALTGCQSAQPSVQKQQPKQYAFWPTAPDEPHIQFLRAFNSSEDVAPPQSHLDEVMYGQRQVLAIVKPYGVAVASGRIYVCDIRSRGITVLDLNQKVAKVVGVGGSIEIGKAVDIAIAPDGNRYVVDSDKKAIVVLDADDHPVDRFAVKDLNPVSVAVYQNELFVVDFTAMVVKVLDRATGRYLRTIGSVGVEDGQFTKPLCVRVDPKGIVFVDDVLTCRIHRFNRDGTFLSSFGQSGNRPGDFVRPKHFSFDKNGDLYIVDSAFNNVQVFDDKQKIAGYFGSAGNHPGAMELPAGIYVDDDPQDLAIFQQYVHPAFQAERLIVVANQFGSQRVSVYAGGRLKPGKTLADVAPTRAKVSAGTSTTSPSTQPDFMPATSAPARTSR